MLPMMPQMNEPTRISIINNNPTMSTITNPETIEKITANVVIKTLVAISGESSYESLNEMIQTLYANATTL